MNQPVSILEERSGPLRFLSLYSGIGLHDLGFTRAGIEVVGQVEWDDYCCAVLEKHWPGLPRWKDVRHVSIDDVRNRCGRIDGITGGFSCKDISVAGKGRGIGKETESGITWRNMFRLIRGLRPAWLIIENVPRLRTLAADRVLAALERIGYACWPSMVGVEHLGAPHRRHRVWIVAYAARNDGDRQHGEVGRGRRTASASHADMGKAAMLGRYAASATQSIGHRQRERTIGGSSESRIVADSGCEHVSGRGITGNISCKARETKVDGEQRERLRDSVGNGGAIVAHADKLGCQLKRGGGLSESTGHSTNEHDVDGCGCGTERPSGNLANTSGAGLKVGSKPENERRNLRDEWTPIAASRVGSRWPSRPGQHQHAWEAPRLVELSLGGEPSGCSAELVRNIASFRGCSDGEAEAWYIRNKVRLDRAQNRFALKALGNGNPPACAEMIGRALLHLREVIVDRRVVA